MIKGAVNAKLEAVIRLTVRGPNGQSRKVDAVIDTGFSAWLSLPPVLIRKLGLPLQEAVRIVLANGTSVEVDVYEAVVVWNKRRRTVPVFAMDSDPLIGMAMLEGNDLRARILRGGELRILPVK